MVNFEDILRLGYVVAWAPYYLVINLGHSYNEILRRLEYYRKKLWLKKGFRISRSSEKVRIL